MSHNKITKVLMIQGDSCGELAYILEWLIKGDINDGILVLTGKRSVCNAKQLEAIEARGIKIFPASARPEMSGMSEISDGIRDENQWLTPTDGFLFGLSDLHRDHLYINANSDVGKLLDNQRFRDLLSRMGIDAQFIPQIHKCIDNGDCIRVKDHLFLGRRTLFNLAQGEAGASVPSRTFCEAAVEQTYKIPPRSMSIDFLEVENFYHLDLYFAYGGIDHDGLDQYFVGEVMNDEPDYEPPKKELCEFKKHKLRNILNNLYGEGKYGLHSLPMIFRSVPGSVTYFYTPLNGIIDYVNNIPRYYMPYPVWGIHSPEPACMADIRACADDAYNRMVKITGDPDRIKKFNVPLYLMAWDGSDGGQSLHCSMVVIGRN